MTLLEPELSYENGLYSGNTEDRKDLENPAMGVLAVSYPDYHIFRDTTSSP